MENSSTSFDQFDQRILPKDKLSYTAKKLFMQYLFEDKRLKLGDRVRGLNRDFPEIAKETWILRIYSGFMSDEPDIFEREAKISYERAKEYFEKLLSDIPQCLRPEKGPTWVLEDLHTRVVFLGFRHRPDSSLYWLHPIDFELKLELKAEVYPEITRKAEVKKWAREELERQVDTEWQKRIETHPDYKKRLREPLDEDTKLGVRWLCRRLIHNYRGEDIKRVYPEDSKRFQASYINERIGDIAKLLQVKLPRGRPTKAKKR